jgi:ATP-dependent helicase/nuclease subunit A
VTDRKSTGKRGAADQQPSLFGNLDEPPPNAATADDVRVRAVPVAPAAPPAAAELPDAAARGYAVDPRHNVVLEASAGTGKTSVLVQRYLNLLGAGVDPANILAITFTRKAAAEMRERIVSALRKAAVESESGRVRWLGLRDRLNDIAISTIDAFCYGLLREFPLEAGLDPAFTLADETEVARLVEEALDHALRACRGVAREDPDVALVFARLTGPRLRAGLAHLLERRLVAHAALGRYLRGGQGRPAEHLTIDAVTARATDRLRDVLAQLSEGLAAFLADGPNEHPRFRLLAIDLRALQDGILSPLAGADPARAAAAFDELRAYFLTQDGRPRTRMTGYSAAQAASKQAWKRHVDAVKSIAPQIKSAFDAWGRDLNIVLARGVNRMLQIALGAYRRTLAEHEVLDFSEVLGRAVDLLRQMDEFSQSRYRLESRYHHVLVDEFQDTSRMQWELVSLLVQSWGEGFGLVHEAPLAPSLFIVGDRKQSIYRFRDADVSLLDEAAFEIGALRPDGPIRRYISRSFRAVPPLLEFVNDLCAELPDGSNRADAFTYDDRDRFPLDGLPPSPLREPPLSVIVSDDVDDCAARVATEIARLLREGTIRDRDTGVARTARPGDIAILFRSRDSHREFEHALDARGIPSYVYKGLGFFDADEIKDLSALMRWLAAPESNLRAAAFLRSRFVRLSDEALLRIGPELAKAVRGELRAGVRELLADEDRAVLARVWTSAPVWLSLVDRLPPAELIDHIIAASAYGLEMPGPRGHQARENVKKMRGLVRRIQNRGYATLGRIAEHLDRLSAGDEANATLEALDAVSLMTVHASKGLEFPVVFLVNIARGVAARRQPIRVLVGAEQEEPSVAVETFISEADTLEPAKEREETKRLLYVAVTRARDRLYLSTLLKEGVYRATPGSLGSVMPASMGTLFAAAARVSADGVGVPWQAAAGRTHEFVVRNVVELPAAEGAVVAPSDDLPVLVDATDPLSSSEDEAVADNAWQRLGVTASLGEEDEDGGDGQRRVAFDGAGALVGRLVHRLFQARAATRAANPDELAALAATLLRPEESLTIAAPGDICRHAADLYVRLAGQPEVLALMAEGECLFEVPFSLRQPSSPDVSTTSPGTIVRGAIDCLIRRVSGEIIVLELKTGAPRVSHERQLALYVDAACALFPDAPVRGLLVYP